MSDVSFDAADESLGLMCTWSVHRKSLDWMLAINSVGLSEKTGLIE